MLGQCGLLVHLNVCYNSIGDDGAGRLVVVLGECRSLAHLDLSYALSPSLTPSLPPCLSLPFPPLLPHEVNDIGVQVVFMNSWPLRSEQQVLT